MKPPTATLRSVAERAPIGYVVVACFLSFACYNLVPGSGTAADVARTAAGVLCAIALLAVGDPAALRPHQRTGWGSTCTVSAGSLSERLGLVGLCTWLLVVACVAGVGSLLAAGDASSSGSPAPGFGPATVSPLASATASDPALVSGHVWLFAPAFGWILLFVVLCLVTGVFEEALFRGVMFKGFVRPLATSRHAKPLLRAAVVSSCVFGVLHVSGEVPVSGFDEVVTAQVVLKPLQAALFGFVMAGVFARSRNLWLICGLHAAFNALSEGPLFLAEGALPVTYLTGSLTDVALLAASVVLLVPAAAKARTWLSGACIL